MHLVEAGVEQSPQVPVQVPTIPTLGRGVPLMVELGFDPFRLPPTATPQPLSVNVEFPISSE